MPEILRPVPTLLSGGSSYVATLCAWSGTIAVWLREDEWRPYGLFKYSGQGKRRFRAVLQTARKYTIRLRESRLVLRRPDGRLAVEFEHAYWTMKFRWNWLGEECAIEVSWRFSLRNEPTPAVLWLGGRRHALHFYSPALDRENQWAVARAVHLAPRRGELRALIEPAPDEIDRRQLENVLLLALMIRSYFETTD